MFSRAPPTEARVTEPNTDVIQGTLDLLILKTLSWGPMHGYGIVSWLEQQSSGTLGVEDNALYQALQRLEARTLVEAEWGITENNRRARYYRLTPLGRKQLKAQVSTWLRYTESVTAIVTLTSKPV
jgi:transcriptional regulator